MAHQWYVRHAGKEVGPFSSADLKKLAEQKKIAPATEVRLGADGAWVAASKVQGLFAAASSTSSASSAAILPTKASAAGAAKAPAKPSAASASSAAQPQHAAQPMAPPIAPPPPPPKARPIAPVNLITSRMPAPEAAPAESVSAKITSAVAVVLGILALSTFMLPYMKSPLGWIPIVVGGLGLVIGIAGFVLSALNKGSGLTLAISGTGSSLVGLVLAIVVGVMTGFFGSAPPPPMKVALPIPVAPPPAPPVAEAPPAEPEPEPKPEPVWTPVADPIDLGNIRARIMTVQVEQIRLESTDFSKVGREAPQPFLKVRVSLENTSTDKIVEFAGWNGGGDALSSGVGALVGREVGGELGKTLQAATATALLTDNAGNAYKQVSATRLSAAAAVGKDNSVRPGKVAVRDVVFPPPLDSIEYLRLELPGTAFGEQESLRYQIPKEAIKGL